MLRELLLAHHIRDGSEAGLPFWIKVREQTTKSSGQDSVDVEQIDHPWNFRPLVAATRMSILWLGNVVWYPIFFVFSKVGMNADRSW